MSELSNAEYDLSLVELEGYRCPIVWELWAHVVPAVMATLFLGVVLGYAWAKAAHHFVR